MSSQEQPTSSDPFISSPTEILLPFSSLNPTGNSNILFIHGAFSTRHEWDLVVPCLPTYHILLPDLLAHNDARHITPFFVPYAAQLLAHLIRAKAKGGKAHVVSLSLGARVAIELAGGFADAVDQVVVSGFKVFPLTRVSAALVPALPYVVWTTHRLENFIPRSWIRWAMDGADIPCSDPSIATVDLCRQIVSAIQTSWSPESSPARTLIVAAGKGGIIPSRDHPHDARRLAATGRDRNAETRAVTHPQMRHPWDRQAPLLFAETVRCWVEREKIPLGFEAQ